MKATVVAIIPETPHTYSFYLEPETPINYKAGDFIYLILPLLKYSDLRGNIRHFSLSSSPSEGNILKITSHEGLSGYKKTLMSLNIGDTVEIDGAHGVYSWPYVDQSIKHVFIAGGIGITPIRSRIKFSRDNKLPLIYRLIYSVKTIDHAMFLDELNDKNLNLVTTQTQPRINKEYLSPVVEENKNAIYWITGSTKFVSDMETILEELGIDTDRIKTEKFTGY